MLEETLPEDDLVVVSRQTSKEEEGLRVASKVKSAEEDLLDLLKEVVQLRVGEKNFTTTVGTLISESNYFLKLLSDDDTPTVDGRLFVDADATLFGHVLAYLRRGAFPICLNEENKPDLPLYTLLLREAEYFQIPRLETWLRNRQYHNAIKVEHRLSVQAGFDIPKGSISTPPRVLVLQDSTSALPTTTTVEYTPMRGPSRILVTASQVTINPALCKVPDVGRKRPQAQTT